MAGSYKTVIKHFEACSDDVRWYFDGFKELVANHPYRVSVAFAFSLVEQAHHSCLYMGAVKNHEVDAQVAWEVIQEERLLVHDFKNFFRIIFGKPLTALVLSDLDAARKIRNKLIHGKTNIADADARKALIHILDYAEKLNKFAEPLGIKGPFGKLSGFKGRGQSAKPATSRWVLKGMGFQA